MKDPYGILNAIKAVMAECECKGCEVEWFLFGSFLDNNAASDVDGECMEVIRTSVEEFLLEFPIELIIMSQAEEAELNFIAATEARCIAEILKK